MTISTKGRRQLDANGRKFVWYVEYDEDGAGPTLAVASADRRVLLRYHLLQGDQTRHVVVIGPEFKNIPAFGGSWRRFRSPAFGTLECVTPRDVRALVDWAREPADALVEVDWLGVAIVPTANAI